MSVNGRGLMKKSGIHRRPPPREEVIEFVEMLIAGKIEIYFYDPHLGGRFS